MMLRDKFKLLHPILTEKNVTYFLTNESILSLITWLSAKDKMIFCRSGHSFTDIQSNLIEQVMVMSTLIEQAGFFDVIRSIRSFDTVDKIADGTVTKAPG